MLSRFKRNGSPASGGRKKVHKSAVNVLTSPVKSMSDKKSYRLINLQNGLKALLIHHDLHPEPEESQENRISESSETESEDDDDEEGEEHEREKLAAVSLGIGAGSFMDHEYGIEGLAHFVGKN